MILMNNRILKYFLFAAFGLACVYLALTDYSTKLETDVSSLLPQAESEEARLARKLINDEQGRAVYIELSGLPEDSMEAEELEAIVVDQLKNSALVGSLVKIDRNENRKAFKVVGDHRLELLFPKWLAKKQKQLLAEGYEEDEVLELAAELAVEEMDEFLESPSAMELARPGLLDPLLLNISSLLALSENESSKLIASPEKQTVKAVYYWVSLAESPFSPDVQDALEKMIYKTNGLLAAVDETVEVRYGGLVRLAAASRNRIQKDVLKMNLLSVFGVLGVSLLLLRKPWRLMFAVPTLASGAVGAMTVSFLVFEQVNVIVLVIGSILIGTTIDYAIHLLFAEHSEDDFPTAKLIAYACLSTVAGFSILLFSEEVLIRQIGVFVGAGLLCAYLMARISINSKSTDDGSGIRKLKKPVGGRLFGFASVLVVLIGFYGLLGMKWKDDVRNLEAPDPRLAYEDMALRERMGSSDGGGSLFLTIGDSYLEMFEDEKMLRASVDEVFPGRTGFGVSEFLSSQEDVALVESMKLDLPGFFEELKIAFEDGGYDVEAFGSFFEDASLFVDELQEGAIDYSALIQEFADGLGGAMSGVIGEIDGRYWGLSSVGINQGEAMTLSTENGSITLFSQLGFLNQSLNHHRETLLLFGCCAMVIVSIVVLFAFGLKKGVIIVLYPLVGGAAAIGICGLLFDALNMFHLIGCFLGGAIALDYSLFAIESYSRNEPIPYSVWLSSGTTTASFIALSFSAIPVVQGLGATVALLACVTLLLLGSSRSWIRKLLI